MDGQSHQSQCSGILCLPPPPGANGQRAPGTGPSPSMRQNSRAVCLPRGGAQVGLAWSYSPADHCRAPPQPHVQVRITHASVQSSPSSLMAKVPHSRPSGLGVSAQAGRQLVWLTLGPEWQAQSKQAMRDYQKVPVQLETWRLAWVTRIPQGVSGWAGWRQAGRCGGLGSCSSLRLELPGCRPDQAEIVEPPAGPEASGPTVDSPFMLEATLPVGHNWHPAAGESRAG